MRVSGKTPDYLGGAYGKLKLSAHFLSDKFSFPSPETTPGVSEGIGGETSEWCPLACDVSLGTRAYVVCYTWLD